MRVFMLGLLTRMGYSAEAANDGQEALELILAQPNAYDLVITDHHMPRLCGLDLVKRLRENAFRGKFIVLSAYLTSVKEAQYRAEGVIQIFPKPLNLSWLRQAIQELLNQPSAVEERFEP